MKKFKKHLSLLLILTVILQLVLNISSFSAGVTYSDPALLESSDAAFYEPYPIKQNATRYAPWLTMYHMQTKKHYDAGLRGGEGGQMIMSAAVSPVNPNLVLFGTDMGGLWRSTDGGDNWYSVTDNINMRAVMGIEFHPTKENLVYCIQGTKGTGLASRLNRTTLDGFYRSTDGGRTWEQVLHVLFLTSAASQELIKFDNKGNVYVLSREGIYKSTDDGENFTLVGKPDSATVDSDEDTEEDPEAEETDSNSGGVYGMWLSGDAQTIVTATGASGIRLSTDGGATWTSKNVSANATGAYSVAVDPKDATHWYAIFSGESKKLYETTDSGDTWTGITHYSYATKNTPVVVKVSYPADSDTLRIHLVNNNMAHHYRYSDDNGVTWNSPTNINSITNDTFTKSTGYNTEALEICSSDSNIVFFSYGDVFYKSTDGGTSFTWANAGYSGNYANNFVFDSRGRLWIPFTDRAMAVTDEAYTKGGYPTATKVIDNATIGTVGIDPTNENNIYVSKGSWSNQTLYKSTDGGSTWTAVTDAETGETISYTSSCRVIQFHSDYENNGVIYAGRYKSSDRGETWTKLSYNIWDISPLDSDMLYSVDGDDAVVRSTDGGETWSVVKTRYSGPETVVADRFDKDRFWVGCYGGQILKCYAGGSYSVIKAANGLTPFGDANNSVVSIVQDPNDENHLLAGTNGPDAKTKTTGLFETYDGGSTWHVVKGLPSTRLVQTLVFTPAGDEVLIGTCSQGTMIYDFKEYKKYLDGNYFVDTSDEILLPSDADKYRVRFGKYQMSFSDAETPYFANGEVYMPLEKIFKEGGYNVVYDSEAGTLSANKEFVSYFVKSGSATIYVDGVETATDNSIQTTNGVLFAPRSFFDYTMEFDAVYIEEMRRVEINLMPAAKITYSYGDVGGESISEYVKNGSSLILGSKLEKAGYELVSWTDDSGNTIALGEEVVVEQDTTFTAVWKRSDNAHFLTAQENNYSPTGAVMITDTYNAETETYGYTVDYQTLYNGNYDAIVDNVKIASTTNRDRRYVAYKLDLSQMGDITSAKLRLSASKANSGGYFFAYGSDGTWGTEFGGTGIAQGATGTFTVRDSLPPIGSKIATSEKVGSGATNVVRYLDISEYLMEKKAASEEYAIVYVIYHMTNTDGRTTFDGCRLYNMNASESLRPTLIVNELEEAETITTSGTIYAQADTLDSAGVPVIAFYKEDENGNLILQNAQVGESTSETTKRISMDIAFEEGEKPVVKFFIWDSTSTLVPQIIEQVIRK